MKNAKNHNNNSNNNSDNCKTSSPVYQTFISDDEIEVIIDNETGESFCSVKGYTRLSGVARTTVQRRLRKGAANFEIKEGKIQTAQGLQRGCLISESIIAGWIVKDNPEIASKMLKAGIRLFLYGIANYKVNVVSPERENDIDLILENLKNQIDKIQQENNQLKNENDELRSNQEGAQASENHIEILSPAMRISSPPQDYIAELNFMEPILKAVLHERSILNSMAIAANEIESVRLAMITSSQANAYFRQGIAQSSFPRPGLQKQREVMALLGWELIKINKRYYYRYPFAV